MPDTSDKSSVLARRSRRSYLPHKPNIYIDAKNFLLTAFHAFTPHEDNSFRRLERKDTVMPN